MFTVTAQMTAPTKTELTLSELTEADEMAFVNTTAPRAATVKLADRFSGVVAAFKAKLARRAVFAQTVRELNVLSDRELADLGIARTEIHAVAADAAYGK